jgi:hypothetical protein
MPSMQSIKALGADSVFGVFGFGGHVGGEIGAASTVPLMGALIASPAPNTARVSLFGNESTFCACNGFPVDLHFGRIGGIGKARPLLLVGGKNLEVCEVYFTE